MENDLITGVAWGLQGSYNKSYIYIESIHSFGTWPVLPSPKRGKFI